MKLRRGMVVAVEFLDHCEGGTAPITCRVYGRISEVGRKHIVVTTWETVAESALVRQANDETFVIVRSAIQKVVELGAA